MLQTTLFVEHLIPCSSFKNDSRTWRKMTVLLERQQRRRPVGPAFIVMKQYGAHHRRPVIYHHWSTAIKRVFRDKERNNCWLVRTRLMASVENSYSVSTIITSLSMKNTYLNGLIWESNKIYLCCYGKYKNKSVKCFEKISIIFCC